MLKNILIIGPCCESTYKELEDLYHSSTDYLIGNGKGGISPESIVKIKDKIDPHTRFDICIHGRTLSNVEKQGKNIETHYVLLESDKCISPTSKLFTWLKEVADGNPLYIHLWSCYSGLAINDVTYLPEGSILIVHANDKPSSVGMDQFGIKRSINRMNENLSPFSDIKTNIPNFFGEWAVSSNFQGNTKSLKIIPQILEVLENPEIVLKNNINNLENFYKDIQSSKSINVTEDKQNLFFKKSDLDNFSISIENVRDYVLGTFIVYCHNNEKSDYEKIINVINQHNDVKEILVTHTLDGEATALNAMVQLKNLCMTKVLLDKKADPNYLSKEYGTALHVAAEGGDVDILTILLAKGADPNIVETKSHRTALYIAAEAGHVQAVKELIEHKANVDIANPI